MRLTDTVSRLALFAAASALMAVLPAMAEPAQPPLAAAPVIEDGSAESPLPLPALTQAEAVDAGSILGAAPEAAADAVADTAAPAPDRMTPSETLQTGSIEASPVTEGPVAETTQAASAAAPESLFTAALPALRDSLSVALESAVATLRAQSPRDADAGVIAEFYERRAFEPAFSDDGGFNNRGRAIEKVLGDAGADGLDPADYAISGGSAAARELSLAASAIRYGRHAYSGRADASRIHPLVTVEPPKISAGDILTGLLGEGDAGAYLASLNPQHEGYRKLRAVLARMQAEEGRERQVVIPAGPMLRPGMRDMRVALLRERFGITAPVADADSYDEAIVAAVKAFQASEGLTEDGIIGPNTLEFLNRGHGDDIAAIVSNMERWRWLPRSLGNRFVYVNVPEFVVRIVENGSVQHMTRVVVGTRRNQTPIFSDQIEYIDVNPSWNVPRSIAVKEMLPEIKNDPDYFSKTNFQVVTEDGRVVDPTMVNWHVYDGASLPYRFRQPPGDGNALGRIEFMFPNKHHVYLHDTPSKSLFARESRAFSHGCVRVQNPIDFATALLKRDTAVSSPMIEQRLQTGQPGELRLSGTIPVHLVYFNVWVNADGTLGRAPDVYEHDAATQAAMRGDYSYYDRSLSAYRAQNVAQFDPQAAREAEEQAARPIQAPPRRVGLFGALFGAR